MIRKSTAAAPGGTAHASPGDRRKTARSATDRDTPSSPTAGSRPFVRQNKIIRRPFILYKIKYYLCEVFNDT